MPLIYKDFIQDIKVDNGTTWEEINPIVEKNVIAFDYDTLRYKLGNGINRYKDLPFCTKYFSDYTNIYPTLDGVTKESFKTIYNNGGYIKRGNIVNLGFEIKVKIDITKMNPTDDINIILLGAPKNYDDSILYSDIRIYGVRPLDESYASFIKGSNSIKIMVRYKTEEEIGEQVDFLVPLEAEDIIDEYLIIQGSICYISSDSPTGEFKLFAINPFTEDRFHNFINYSSNDSISSFQFNMQLYKNPLSIKSPTDNFIEMGIISDIKTPPVGLISGNINCIGINAHNVKLKYIGEEDGIKKFRFVSVIGENTFNIKYSNIPSKKVRFSGIFTY